MKKIIGILLGIFCLSAILISCTKEGMVQQEKRNQGNRITAAIEQPVLTKIALGQENAGITPINWKHGDKIYISGVNKDEKVLFELEPASEGKNTATFVSEYTLGEDTEYIAVYPNMDRGHEGKDIIKPVLKKSFDMTAVVNNIHADNMVMAAVAGPDKKFEFKNIFGILRLNMKGNVKIMSISVTSHNYIIGRMKINISDLNNITYDKDGMSSYSSKTIQLVTNSGIPLKSNQETSFNIGIPPTKAGDTAELKVSIRYENSKGESKTINKVIPNLPENKIVRSKITIMPTLDITE